MASLSVLWKICALKHCHCHSPATTLLITGSIGITSKLMHLPFRSERGVTWLLFPVCHSFEVSKRHETTFSINADRWRKPLQLVSSCLSYCTILVLGTDLDVLWLIISLLWGLFVLFKRKFVTCFLYQFFCVIKPEQDTIFRVMDEGWSSLLKRGWSLADAMMQFFGGKFRFFTFFFLTMRFWAIES